MGVWTTGCAVKRFVRRASLEASVWYSSKQCSVRADKMLSAPAVKAGNSRKKFRALCAKSCFGQSILNGRFQQSGYLGEFAPLAAPNNGDIKQESSKCSLLIRA